MKKMTLMSYKKKQKNAYYTYTILLHEKNTNQFRKNDTQSSSNN